MTFSNSSSTFLAAVVSLAVLSACTTPQPGENIHDPYEETNRKVHNFNKQLDQAVLRPAGQVASHVPDEIQDGVANFADNVALPGMILNGLLQADVGGAATNTMRFLINTTAGIGGLFDPAGVIGLAEESTDFGETLYVWGVPEGAYIELPAFGPSTERDAVGRFVDMALDPLARFGSDEVATAATVANGTDLVMDRGRFSDTIDSVLYESADSYAQSRLFYLQNRRFDLGDTSFDTQINPYDDPLLSDPTLDLDLFE